MGLNNPATEGLKRGGQGDIYVSLAEATKLVAKAESTVRNWVKSKQVRAKQSTEGWWLIDRNSLLAHAALTPSTKGLRGGQSKHLKNTPPFIDPLNAPLNTPQPTPLENSLRESLERERRLNDQLQTKNEFLEKELLKITHELKSLLSGKTGNTLSRWVQTLRKS